MMKCKCGGEINLITGQCKKCKVQNITMSGNAFIKMTNGKGNSTELRSTNKDEKNNKQK